MTATTRTAIFDRVVCGVDRSDEGLAAARAAALVAEPAGELTLVTAYEAARTLAARTGAELRAIVATRDARVDVEAAKAIAPECEEHDARALDALDVASETADLVVVGGRGLRGLRALGSLSERLAHEARSSVLVVRAR